MKKIPIGLSDFKKLIEGNYYYFDKTNFIDENGVISGLF